MLKFEKLERLLADGECVTFSVTRNNGTYIVSVTSNAMRDSKIPPVIVKGTLADMEAYFESEFAALAPQIKSFSSNALEVAKNLKSSSNKSNAKNNVKPAPKANQAQAKLEIPDKDENEDEATDETEDLEEEAQEEVKPVSNAKKQQEKLATKIEEKKKEQSDLFAAAGKVITPEPPKPEVKQEPKPEPKAEVKPEPKSEPKPQQKPAYVHATAAEPVAAASIDDLDETPAPVVASEPVATAAPVTETLVDESW